MQTYTFIECSQEWNCIYFAHTTSGDIGIKIKYREFVVQKETRVLKEPD
jgi:hypothetical protein